MVTRTDKLSLLGETVEGETDPKELLSAIFRFMNFKPAKMKLYFYLLDSGKAQTVDDICTGLRFSERTIRKYLQELVRKGYVKRQSTVRERPCYAYTAAKPQQVWKKLVEEVRQIRIKVTKTFKGKV